MWTLLPSEALWTPGPSQRITVVALDLWDHLKRRVTPILAVYATATVLVTIAAGTWYAWYGYGLYIHIRSYMSIVRNFILL